MQYYLQINARDRIAFDFDHKASKRTFHKLCIVQLDNEYRALDSSHLLPLFRCYYK